MKEMLSWPILVISDDRCPPIPVFPYAEIMSPVCTDVGTMVNYTCISGYEFNGGGNSYNLTCVSSRIWQGSTQLQALCTRAYTVFARSSSRLKQWLMILCLTYCDWLLYSARICPALPWVNNGQWYGGNMAFGSHAQLNCDLGYTISTNSINASLDCTASGTWSHDATNITCEG